MNNAVQLEDGRASNHGPASQKQNRVSQNRTTAQQPTGARSQAPRVAGQADAAGQPSSAQRWLANLLTVGLFMVSLFTGLSVTTAALFSDSIASQDEPATAKWYMSFNLSVIYGLGLLVYSMGGMAMQCMRRLPGQFQLWQIWATSAGLSLMGNLRVLMMSPEPAVTEVTGREVDR